MAKNKIDLLKCKHPNSRKTKALAKHNKRLQTKQKNKVGQAIKQNLIGEKVLWFKDNLSSNLNCYTPEETEELIIKYLSRFNDELEQIKLKHSIGNRKNRQHANREDVLNLTIKREQEEFQTCGIELPNIMDTTQLEMLRNWNGELRFLQNFKLVRISRKHLETSKQGIVKEKKAVINKTISEMCVE